MPTRAEVRPRVQHNLAVISGHEEEEIRDSVDQLLARDLGLTEDLRAALAPGFEKIARDYQPDARITRAECKQLKHTTAAIDLVLNRAGGTP